MKAYVLGKGQTKYGAHPQALENKICKQEANNDMSAGPSSVKQRIKQFLLFSSRLTRMAPVRTPALATYDHHKI